MKRFIVLIALMFCFFIHIQLEPTSKKAHLRKYQTITKQIDAIIDNNPHLHVGCEIYSLTNDQCVYCHNEQRLFTPASNTKLFSALLALETLGPDYRFETVLATDGVQDGTTLTGNVYLKSSGDPSLKGRDLEDLIKMLHKKGITTIVGNVCIDHDDFDQDGFTLGSFLDNLGASWNSPINSFMVDRKPLGLNPTNTVTFMNNDRMKNIYFDGISFLKTMGQNYGIELKGNIIFGKMPKNCAKIGSHFSQNNAQLLSYMLKESDNVYADCIFKRIGANQYGCPGTWAKGTQALTVFLAKIESIEGDFMFKDGSGISRYNLVSPHQIIALLDWIYTKPYFSSYKESLAIVGVDGTLKDRLVELTSQVKAKTGTLTGVSSLSGYIETEDDLFAFAILVNGYVSQSIYNPPCKTDIENEICKIIAAA